jgi:hypothetical protein
LAIDARAAADSPGPRWWDGTRWTKDVAAPGSVMDRDAFEARRTWGQADYLLSDPAGNTLGDAYELPTSRQSEQSPSVLTGIEVMIRDTRQAQILSAVRTGAEPCVSICGPGHTTLGTISYGDEGSQRTIAVTLGERRAFRIGRPTGRAAGPAREFGSESSVGTALRWAA